MFCLIIFMIGRMFQIAVQIIFTQPCRGSAGQTGLSQVWDYWRLQRKVVPSRCGIQQSDRTYLLGHKYPGKFIINPDKITCIVVIFRLIYIQIFFRND